LAVAVRAVITLFQLMAVVVAVEQVDTVVLLYVFLLE
jgi:hypothetical protein